MNKVFSKPEIISSLKESKAILTEWVKSQPDENFNKTFIEDKWTIAGHIYHLCKTLKASNVGLKMPKLVLSMKFGKCNREERNYEMLKEKYLNALGTGIKAPSNFEAEKGRVFDKEQLLKRFGDEIDTMIKSFGKKDESYLSTYVVPHPAIGKLSIRELGMWNVIHNAHHLETLKVKNT